MGIGKIKSGDKIALSDIEILDKLSPSSDDELNLKLATGYKVVSYNCVLIPSKGQAETIIGINENISLTLKEIATRMGPGTKIIFDDILLKNDSGAGKKGSPFYFTINEGIKLFPLAKKDFYNVNELLAIETLYVINTSTAIEEKYQVSHYDLLLAPISGPKETFIINNGKFSTEIKKHIKNLTTGDRIILDNIEFTRPDGTIGVCQPVKIIIK